MISYSIIIPKIPRFCKRHRGKNPVFMRIYAYFRHQLGGAEYDDFGKLALNY